MCIRDRFTSFKETFASPLIENVFKYILKDEGFDCIHIWSFKNHSLNYPFIAGERSIPVIISICDGFLSTPFIFEKGCIGSGFSEKTKIRISNFVSSPVSEFFRKTGGMFSAGTDKSGSWFELIGRYTKFYNKSPASLIDSNVWNERKRLSLEIIDFADKFIVNSEAEYNFCYRNSIPENKVIFMEQGGASRAIVDPKPFEIEGAVKFGFMGELLPEDGIEELIDAFNLLYREGFQNEIHIYGEIVKNKHYFNRLNKTSGNSNIFMRGPIEPGRLNAALGTFDVLIIPSKWQRNDTFLLKTAISNRKAVIVPAKNKMAEIVSKYSRGLILDEISSDSIFNAVSELERNRKRLYYFMRITDDFRVKMMEDNKNTLINLYNSLSKKKIDVDNMLLKRKLHRKKIERLRG